MEELFLRRKPSSAEAEQAVLGAMLLDPRCVPEVIERLHADDFYYQANNDMYSTILSMFSLARPIDPVTVLNEMRVRGVFDEQTTRQYVARLMESTPTVANVARYTEIVREKSMLRALSDAAEDIGAMVSEESGEAEAILESAEQKVYGIRNGRTNQGLYHIEAVLLEVYNRLGELSKSPGKLPGISTGISEVDSIISGLGNSDLVLLASRPGMGKTSIALNMAMSAAKSTGKSVVFFSLEMSREQLAMRLLSGESFVDSKKLLTGMLSPEDWKKLARATSVISKVDFRMDDNPAITCPEMKAKCRRLDNLGLIVIDYLQLMQSARKSENRVQEVSEISRSLKIMAKELNVPVLCLSQLSRANEKRVDRRPQLSDLRESGAIEQDADVVMFLYRDDYYKDAEEMSNVAECIIAKNRHGETGKVELMWLPQYTTFSSKEWKHDRAPGG